MRRGVPALLLWPLSLLFRALVAARRVLYSCGVLQTVKLPVPVIVVGNVFIGGTGKTPFTIWLVETLKQAGYTPGVISRGHGAKNQDAPQLVTGETDPREAGDEPVLIAARSGCPLAIGRDRIAAAQKLLSAHPPINVIVSDDGLQHYRLQRDLEIVLFDTRGAGNGWMLPAGPLREPASRRADFTFVNGGATTAHDTMRLEGDMAERLSDRSQRVTLASLRGSRIVAAAGIGNPERFFSMLRAAGLTFEALPLPDHHAFDDQPFSAVSAEVILITEKDAVKCSRIEALKNDPRLWVVPVTAHIDHAVTQKILEKLRGLTTA
jgi:tetraacyldisaccharide 4'-kinase